MNPKVKVNTYNFSQTPLTPKLIPCHCLCFPSSAIDPHLIQNTCMYIDPKTGRYVKPEWKDAPTGDSYRPSYNIGPTIFT